MAITTGGRLRRGLTLLFGGLLAGLVAVPAVVWLWLQWSDTAFVGYAHLRGQPLPSPQDLPALLEQTAADYEAARVTLHIGPYRAHGSRKILGAKLTTASVLDRISGLGRSGSPLIDLQDLWLARTGQLDVPWPPTIDRQQLQQTLARLRSTLERPPVPGTLGPDGKLIAGLPGLTVNAVQAAAQVEHGLRTDAEDLHLATTRIPPPSPVDAESYADGAGLQVLMYSFETHYRIRRHEWGRARNVEMAAAALNNAVLERRSA